MLWTDLPTGASKSPLITEEMEAAEVLLAHVEDRRARGKAPARPRPNLPARESLGRLGAGRRLSNLPRSGRAGSTIGSVGGRGQPTSAPRHPLGL